MAGVKFGNIFVGPAQEVPAAETEFSWNPNVNMCVYINRRKCREEMEKQGGSREMFLLWYVCRKGEKKCVFYRKSLREEEKAREQQQEQQSQNTGDVRNVVTHDKCRDRGIL
ncbi:hypothetical protein RUM43_000557 [Polyplax serrata]|uniref:Uncharacterized protein n=1 Tax=Polyplax serrata TaxID=468196 RepID=A0AAN8XP75_POLSC